MKKYDKMMDFLDDISGLPITAEIQDAFIKAWGKIHGYRIDDEPPFTLYPVIMVSVSGGADSDIMMDMIERIGHPLSKVHYVFFDTGIEFAATKEHLKFLESKYGVEIERYKAKIPVPMGVKKYGVPFLSKQVSQFINRLQKHNFKWEDKPFDELYAEYPHCKAALRWWCNEWGEKSKTNISNNKWLKEFMIENPPDFLISDGCCNGAKMIEKQINPDLSCQGVRKAEGGARSTAYTSCFDDVFGGCDRFRPIFWFKKQDKEAYEQCFDIIHSDCYLKYGLSRTGCACCPFGKDFEKELNAAEQFEPKLYNAAIHIFGKSYEYTRKYREFYQKMNKQERK